MLRAALHHISVNISEVLQDGSLKISIDYWRPFKLLHTFWPTESLLHYVH